MGKKDLWEIAEEINESLAADKEKRFILYGKDHHSADKSASLFERLIEDKDLNLLDKAHKFFFPKSFHKTKNKFLIKLDNHMNMDYRIVDYIQPMQEEMIQITKEFSDKYNLQYFKYPKRD